MMKESLAKVGFNELSDYASLEMGHLSTWAIPLSVSLHAEQIVLPLLAKAQLREYKCCLAENECLLFQTLRNL